MYFYFNLRLLLFFNFYIIKLKLVLNTCFVCFYIIQLMAGSQGQQENLCGLRDSGGPGNC